MWASRARPLAARQPPATSGRSRDSPSFPPDRRTRLLGCKSAAGIAWLSPLSFEHTRDRPKIGRGSSILLGGELIRIPDEADSQIHAQKLGRGSPAACEIVLVAGREPGPGQEVVLAQRREAEPTADPEAITERGVVGLKQGYGGGLEIIVPRAVMHAQDHWNGRKV